ncbi:sulfate transporter/antisigma-factor antagonist STAS [Thauera sp. 27]|uniref:STAS domain-containing protein n=1 Tax=Thauera sp. 27 TaxID=305700 RepID=UPI0002D05FB7|nr:STAS domain-containing protein [Thauera sp. 27]ENO80554.1 sulfate transporter/antisigma-factor antagonist STAS [Thauera sp. 27]
MALSFFGKKVPSVTPVPEVERAPAAVELPPPTELSGLDFSATDHGRALGRAAGLVEVQEVGAGIGAAYEEAAVLYANGSDAEALALLEATVGDERANVGEGIWLMLLDLYRLGGHKQRFESSVLDYATRFERSPPAWLDLSGRLVRPGQPLPPLVNLTGQLGAQAGKQFEQVAAIARRAGAVRIDVGRVRGVDDAGCGVWRRLLAELAADRVKVTLLNVAALADILGGRLAPGKAEERDTWLMMLELLQYAGDQARFEDIAVDYAVTFEESPPSWECRGAEPRAALPQAASAPASVTDPDVLVLEGELSGAANDAIKRLAAFATERRVLKVDCARLRRIDFVCAGTLFNILANLQAQGTLVSLFDVNAMVGALLRVMSVDQVAHVTLRQ